MSKVHKQSRWKRYVVSGCFQLAHDYVYCIWEGEATSQLTAMRKAAQELWRRPKVKWKHVIGASLEIRQPAVGAQLKEHHDQPPIQRDGSKSRHRRK